MPEPAPVRVTPYRDGPYLLRGPFELVDQDGNVIEAGRRTVALCRCGRCILDAWARGESSLRKQL